MNTKEGHRGPKSVIDSKEEDNMKSLPDIRDVIGQNDDNGMEEVNFDNNTFNMLFVRRDRAGTQKQLEIRPDEKIQSVEVT